MTLFSVTKKNIKGNFKSYLLYFISMIISVVIYYTFISLQFSEEIQKSMQSSQSLESVITQASIILILFVTVFIWYSNSFFTRKRKKEVALYSLLGIRKKTIGRMLFYENLIMGSGAIVAGIGLGTLLSKLFIMMFLKLLDSAIEIHFTISLQAILRVLLVFSVIILVTSVQSFLLIYRFRLVELFQAEKEGEQAPKSSAVAAVASVVLLAIGYWTVFQPMLTNEQFGRNMLIMLVTFVVGTYLLFRSAILFILKMAQGYKASYYQGMNLISTSYLLYRIKGSTRTYTIIALLSAVTLCAISVGYTNYYNVMKEVEIESPFSYTHLSRNAFYDSEVRKIVTEDSQHAVTAELDIPIIQIRGVASELKYVPSGMKAEDIPIQLISESTANQISKALHREQTIRLNGSEAAAIQPRFTNFTLADFKGKSVKLKTPTGDRQVTFEDYMEDRVMPWKFPDIYFIVSDSLFTELSQQMKPAVYKAYKVKDERTTKETSLKLKQISGQEDQLFTYYNIYRKNIESAGLDIFTLGFLGLVFLAATGCIIYFKQLTEAHSDKERYNILRKIGVSRKEVRSSIAKQTLFVFGLPLLVGIVHCTMILKALSTIQLIQDSTIPVITCMSIYLVMYLGYYFFTVASTNRIVNS